MYCGIEPAPSHDAPAVVVMAIRQGSVRVGVDDREAFGRVDLKASDPNSGPDNMQELNPALTPSAFACGNRSGSESTCSRTRARSGALN